MKRSGGDINELKPPGIGDTQVIDLADVHLSDIDLSSPDGVASAVRVTAPPPLPVLPPIDSSASPSASTSVAPPAVAEPSPPARQRSTGFYVGVLVAFLALSLVAGFGIASSLRRAAPTASTNPTSALPAAAAAPPDPAATATATATPSAESAPRVITIAPVEVE